MMIRALIKRPGSKAVIQEFKNVNEIYKTVSSGSVEFITFSRKLDIGLYLNDNGYYSSKSPNFMYNGHIVYGTVIFVGLDDDGAAKRITNAQIAFVEKYLDHNLIRSD